MEKLKIQYFDPKDLIPYANNHKLHSEDQINRLAGIMAEFGVDQPLVVDKHMVLIKGHGRREAAIKIGLKSVPVVVADHLDEYQVKAARIADNKITSNEYNYDALRFDIGTLSMHDFNLNLTGLDSLEIIDLKLDNLDLNSENFDLINREIEGQEKKDVKMDPYADGGISGNLVANFIVPPFSVFDTKQGYWKQRKEMWLKKTGNLSASKENVLGDSESIISSINDGSSNFDPVLAEIMYKWFCIPNGKILDPFGGEQTKGVVAGCLDMSYSAVEFRKEQVEINKKACSKYKNITYVCGDSNNISNLLPLIGYDFCFTSPPYYDLEIYSKEDMSALGSYEEFMKQYENIFKQCYNMLNENSFLAVKIGEIRDKKTGAFRNFVGDNISVFLSLGFIYYNEFVLISPAGTAQLRAAKMMNGSRKNVKLHQNVLVFYKGDINKIKDKFKDIVPTAGLIYEQD